jgi:hypothetical protein
MAYFLKSRISKNRLAFSMSFLMNINENANGKIIFIDEKMEESLRIFSKINAL